ncbi:10397_t:CDS:2 [Entrophospora sp. SA101]|nr:10397_t:CDS:2 [Entrophospora sp. SA101]
MLATSFDKNLSQRISHRFVGLPFNQYADMSKFIHSIPVLLDQSCEAFAIYIKSPDEIFQYQFTPVGVSNSCKTATENPNKDSCANKGEGKPFENTTEDLENLMKIVTDIFGDKNILNKILEMQSKEQKNGAKKSANFAEIKRNINDKENVTIVTDHKVSDKMEISPEEKILIDMEKI